MTPAIDPMMTELQTVTNAQGAVIATNPARHPFNVIPRSGFPSRIHAVIVAVRVAKAAAVFVVTAGQGVRERSEDAKQKGEFFLAHGLQALAIETAEACAEWLHRRIREDWGFADPADMTMQERFTSKYRGKRYSPGYPACPRLEDQQGIFTLLRPQEIGVELTDGFMMDPEASVSAIVFHHPDCAYFNAAESRE